MKNVMIVLLLALAIIFSSCGANAGQSDVTITDPKQTTTTEYKKPPQLTTSYNGEQSEEPVYSAPELDAQGNFIIESASHLMWFADHVNTTAETISVSIKAILVNDIDLSGVDEWVPIGKDGFSVFRGVFDGNGHVISGLKVTVKDGKGDNYVALFGVTHGATIKNLTVRDFEINGSNFTAGICASNGGVIENCSITAKISGNTSLGGICGFNSGTIINCKSYGSVVGSDNMVGGICGYNYGGVIKDSLNSAEIEGNTCVGGISGYSDKGSIGSSSNEGKINANSYAGGICGRFDSQVKYDMVGGKLGRTDENFADNAEITDSLNSAKVNAIISHAGGICGYSNAYIAFCENSGEISAENYAGGIAAESRSGALFAVTNNGSVATGDSYAAGILAQSYVPIVMANNSGDVMSKGQMAGGISVNNMASGIYYSQNTAIISAADKAAGLCVVAKAPVSGCASLGRVACTEVSGSAFALVIEVSGSEFKLDQCFYLIGISDLIIPEGQVHAIYFSIDQSHIESGALAHRLTELSSNCTNEVFWGFMIGRSSLPEITDEPSMRVYLVNKFETCDKSDVGITAYSNTNQDIAPPHAVTDGVCTVCGKNAEDGQ